MDGTQQDYKLAFGLGVMEQVKKGEVSYKRAQPRDVIQGRSTVPVWMRR